MQTNFDNHPGQNVGVSVHSGFPNAAEDRSASSQALDFNQLLVRHPSSTFCFRISGQAHEDRGIFDGDIAVIDRALAPQPSDLVVCFLDGSDDFVITYFRRHKPHSSVWGVVTAVIHQTRRQQLPAENRTGHVGGPRNLRGAES